MFPFHAKEWSLKNKGQSADAKMLDLLHSKHFKKVTHSSSLAIGKAQQFHQPVWTLVCSVVLGIISMNRAL